MEYIKSFVEQNMFFDSNPNDLIDPKLIIHGGDLSDTTYAWGFDADTLFLDVYQQVYDAGIPFISILGNHDLIGGDDGPPDTEAEDFVRKSFEKAQYLADFTYEEIPRDDNSVNSYFVANFRGLQLATVNHRLESTNNSQWESFQSKLDNSKPALFFSHRPLWAQDGTLKTFIETFKNPAHYAGHVHVYIDESASAGFTSYVAPYPHDWEYPTDTNTTGSYLQPGFLAILVSPTEGVLETKLINFDYGSLTECWADGTECVAKISCSECCHEARTDLGTKCGGEKWGDGKECALDTTCDYCLNPASYWEGKLFTACGTEPCWEDGTACAVGTTCNNCCHGSRWNAWPPTQTCN
jgi:hypothetical protein